MAGIPIVGIRLVAIGVEAFRIAGRAVAGMNAEFSGIAPAATQAAAAMNQTGDAVDDFNRNANTVPGIVDRIRQGFHNLVVVVATVTGIVTAATAAIGTLVQAFSVLQAVRFAAEIERDFSFIRAVLQATNEEMVQLRGTAESLAANIATPFRDLTTQLRELGRAGVSLDEITAGVGKLTASLAILSRGEASPQKIAEGISSGLNAFKATGDTADEIARSILGVANATRLAIPEVLNAFTKSAPTAGLFGITSEQLGAFIALVGSAGIRGEEAGTGIRNFFLRMANPSREAAEEMERFNLSFFDVSGSVRPVVDVINDLQQAYGEQAIATGRITEANRAYSLSQIFQTRTAAVAALAIIQGTEAYNEYLAVIGETDPVEQAAVATDNLLDKLLILRNRGQLLANEFGSNLLPGLRSFVDRLNETVGDVSQPDNRLRQVAGAFGQGFASLFTGQGIGEAADALESQFGSTVANVFEGVALNAARIRDIFVTELIPAVGDFFGALGRLAVDTVFNPGAVVTFGDAIVQVTGFTVGLVRALEVVVNAIADIIPTARTMASEIGEAFGKIFSAIGTTVKDLFKGFQDASNPLLEQAANLRNTADEIEKVLGKGSAPGLRRDAQIFEDLAGGLGSVGRTAQIISGNFEAITDRISKASAELQEMNRKEEGIRRVAAAIRHEQEVLADLQRQQLQDEGPDVSFRIQQTEAAIGTLQDYLREQGGTSVVDDAVAQARQRVKEATDALNASVGESEGHFDNLAEAGRRARQEQEAIETATRRLTNVYEDLSRGVEKSTREVQDRIDDLVTKTNQQFRRLEQNVAERMDDIQRKLDEAAFDAQDAFNFETTMRNQRTVVQRGFEDIRTIASRSFDDISRADQDAIQDRDTLRQRELQSIQDFLGREQEARARANSETNEEASRNASERFENIQRAFSRNQQREVETLSRQFDAQNTTRARATEDEERRLRLATELSKAKTSEERRSIQERFNEETAGLTRRRSIENRENQIRLDQQKQLQTLRQQQEDQQVQMQRSIARQELQIRRDLARQEREFRVAEELRFQIIRFKFEDAFVRQSRLLRDTIDIPRQRELEGGQRTVERFLQDEEIRVEDVVRLIQFARDEELRQRAAERQRTDVVRNAEQQNTQIMEQFAQTLEQLARDATQKNNDALAQAFNTAADIQRQVGRNFPALDQFRGNVQGLFGGAGAQQRAIIDGATGGLQPAELQRAGVSVQISLNNSTRQLSLDIQKLERTLNDKTTLGGVNVQFDDVVNNGILIGDNAGSRFAQLAGNAIAGTVAPKGGR